jgi:hypothetical protein
MCCHGKSNPCPLACQSFYQLNYTTCTSNISCAIFRCRVLACGRPHLRKLKCPQLHTLVTILYGPQGPCKLIYLMIKLNQFTINIDTYIKIYNVVTYLFIDIFPFVMRSCHWRCGVRNLGLNTSWVRRNPYRATLIVVLIILIYKKWQCRKIPREFFFFIALDLRYYLIPSEYSHCLLSRLFDIKEYYNILSFCSLLAAEHFFSYPMAVSCYLPLTGMYI